VNLAALAWRHLWARPLVAVLNLLLLTLGLAAMSFVILTSEQLEHTVQRELTGIDLVVGAKGSPLQLILAGVFHLDTPTGNIPLSAVQTLREHPLVARVVPLSLGDAVGGFRIVGTTPDYLALYGAQLASGRVWHKPLEAVLGADAATELGLRVGDVFHGAHGLGEGGAAHAGTPYQVTGILARQRGVLDRLVLTSSESVWVVHETAHGPAHAAASAPSAGAAHEPDHGDHDHDHDHDHDKAKDSPATSAPAQIEPAGREVTLLLVSYRSPIAAVSLPRWVNSHSALQAAAPPLEVARLLKLVGAGTEVLRGFGVVLLLAGALSVFIGLYHAVRERQLDLAMMRMLGAPPWRVATLVAAEALWLALLGVVLGLALGHGLTQLLGWYLHHERSVSITGAWLSPSEALVPLLALALALLSAALPAWRAYRLDVTRLLQAP
jgi:putative ABC transport system permease protein